VNAPAGNLVANHAFAEFEIRIDPFHRAILRLPQP
jgi:hypothetical protein